MNETSILENARKKIKAKKSQANLKSFLFTIPNINEQLMSFNGTVKTNSHAEQELVNQKQYQSELHPARERSECNVCTDISTGSHFGGISCESCKAFFRRSVQNNRFMEYRCLYENRCNMNKSTRKICQACRYRVCLAIGMKAKWVLSDSERQQKYGSRRYATKGQTRTKNPQDQTAKMFTQNSNGSSVEANEFMYSSPADFDTSPMSLHSSQDNNEYESPMPNIDPNLLLEDQYYMNAIDAIDATNLNLTDYEKVLIDKLTFAFYYARRYHSIELTDLTQKIGELKKGLIVDERLSKIVLANFMVQPVKRVITFAKLLPDFRKLQVEDQLALLRGSTLEISICSAISLFDTKTNSINNVISKDRNIPCDNTSADNLNLKLELLKFIWPQEVLENTLKYLKSMKSYDIDEVTLLLYLPLILFSPDRRDLVNRMRVLQIQSKYSIILKKFLTYKYRTNMQAADDLYQALLLKLIDLRSLHELHSAILVAADQTQLEMESKAILKNANEESVMLNKTGSSITTSSISSISSSVNSPYSLLNSYETSFVNYE